GSTAPGHPAAPTAYDYREVVQSSGVVPDSGTGVPGFVAGMALLHDEHGQLPWSELLDPAIDLAQDGVQVSWFVAQELDSPAGRRPVRSPSSARTAGACWRRETCSCRRTSRRP